MIINLMVTTSNCSVDTPATIFVDVEKYLKFKSIDIVRIAGTWELKKANIMVIEVWKAIIYHCIIFIKHYSKILRDVG